MKEGSMIPLLILVTFTTLCLESFSEGLMFDQSPFGSMMSPGGGMHHAPLIHNHYHAPVHMMPHHGYGHYGMNHYGTAGMYHHHMYRRSVPKSGKSKKRESNSKLKKEKEEDKSISSSESSSEEENVRDNSKYHDHYHPPSIIVRHNGETLFESDKCVEGKSTDKESKNQTIPNQGFPQMYPQPIIYGYPMGQQPIIPNAPMWQNSPYLEGAILDQSHPLNNMAMPPQLPSVPQLPQTQHYAWSPSLPMNSPQIPSNIQQPIMSPHQQLPPMNPIMPQHGYQQYAMPPQMPQIQQSMIQAPPLAYDHMSNQPLSPQYMTPVDQQIYQSQLMNHPQAPLHMPPSNQLHPSMARPIVFMPQQGYHPNTQPITTIPSKLHRTPLCPNPPCTSLYGKRSQDQQVAKNGFYNFLNPNRYMDSIDQIMHPYIFT